MERRASRPRRAAQARLFDPFSRSAPGCLDFPEPSYRVGLRLVPFENLEIYWPSPHPLSNQLRNHSPFPIRGTSHAANRTRVGGHPIRRRVSARYADRRVWFGGSLFLSPSGVQRCGTPWLFWL